MKTLYESLLDDNVGDDSLISTFFNSLINAKSSKEFKSLAISLKTYLDEDLGNDYTKAYEKTKRNRSGHYLAIIDLGIPTNEDLCKIMIATGPSTVCYLRFFKSTNKVHIMKTNTSFQDVVTEGDQIYVLNDKWNELRKMIINKK